MTDNDFPVWGVDPQYRDLRERLLDDGVCVGLDPGVWLLKPGESAATARRLCAECPVRVECLEFAIGNGEPVGIWGGMTPEERVRYKRRTGR
jgi:WhiB family redox-sensing transcriptional regulator